MKKLNYKKAIKLINKLVPYVKGIRNGLFDNQYAEITTAIFRMELQFYTKIQEEKIKNATK